MQLQQVQCCNESVLNCGLAQNLRDGAAQNLVTVHCMQTIAEELQRSPYLVRVAIDQSWTDSADVVDSGLRCVVSYAVVYRHRRKEERLQQLRSEQALQEDEQLTLTPRINPASRHMALHLARRVAAQDPRLLTVIQSQPQGWVLGARPPGPTPRCSNPASGLHLAVTWNIGSVQSATCAL